MNMEKKGASESRQRWVWYACLFVLIPVLIPLACLYLRDRGWGGLNLTVIALLFAGYWSAILLVAARVLRARPAWSPPQLASPLIELHLSLDLRARLAAFAAAREQKPAVAAFELLDQEIPRFEQEDDRRRARHDNENLRQQAGQGAFLVAVTTEILKRLLLLSGAGEEDRRVWRSRISETALRIVSNALEQRA